MLRCNYVEREIYVDVITGTPSSTPVKPTLQRSAGVHDLGLALIYVGPNALGISQNNVTDVRFDNSYCGVVTGVVDTIDTSELFAQYQAAWDLLMQSFSGDEQAIIAAYDNLNRIRPLEIGGTNLLLNSALSVRRIGLRQIRLQL